MPEKQITDKITAHTRALSLQLIIYQGLFLNIYVFLFMVCQAVKIPMVGGREEIGLVLIHCRTELCICFYKKEHVI